MKIPNAAAMYDASSLPIVLTIPEMAVLYRISIATIRRQLQNGTFAPRPWEKYPYRWRREDVIADLGRLRPEQRRRAHGFASKPKSAKAELVPTKTKRRKVS